jgi:hypothetical protein
VAQGGNHAGDFGLSVTFKVIVKIDGIGNTQPPGQPARQHDLRDVGSADQHIRPERAQAAKQVEGIGQQAGQQQASQGSRLPSQTPGGRGDLMCLGAFLMSLVTQTKTAHLMPKFRKLARYFIQTGIAVDDDVLAHIMSIA